jgi:hypothetical protein
VFISSPTPEASAVDSDTVQALTLPDGTRTTKSTSLDYVVANFDGITETDNVIETVTYQRLRVGVLDQVGKSVVLLGSVNNETSKATFKYINQVAKDYGIQKIYWFDPNVGGSRGVDIIPNVLDPQNNQTAPIIAGKGSTKGLWAQLTTNLHSNAKGSWLKYIDESYESADTHLLVYNKTAAGVANPEAIPDKVLVKDSDLTAINADNGAAFKTSLETTFDNAGLTKNQTLETTNFDDWDFFQTAFSESPTVESLGIDSREKFKIQTVTQSELVNILNVPGTHNVFMSGSWCGDSKQVIAYIAENAYRYNQPVYLYDFRVDGSASGIGDQAHTLRPETPTSEFVYWENGDIYNRAYDSPGVQKTTGGQAGYGDSGIGFLGNELVELFAPFNSGTANYVQWYHPNGDLTTSLVKASQRNFRSPFLIQYTKGNNDEKGTVVDDWTHEYQDYEIPYAASQYAQYPITPGFYADYETSSGPLSAIQKRAGFSRLSEFFSGNPVVAHNAPGTISTTISADNGCGGSDDDPLDNSGSSDLLPYNGTDEYDVTNYNLNVGYYPAGGFLSDGVTDATADTFEGTAVITATAKTGLNTISLDFREAVVDADNVTVKVGEIDKTVTLVDTTEHNYSIDQHKINISLSSSISKNAVFEVTIPYSVGTVEDSLDSNPNEPNGFTSRVDGKGFVATGEPLGSTYWFPSNNTPADGATYNITLTTPKSVSGSTFTSISAGKRLSKGNQPGASTREQTTWAINTPTSPYQVFAGFGAYTELASTVTLSDNSTVQGLSFVNSTLYSANTNGARNKADYYYSHLAKYIQDLEAIAGKYPGAGADGSVGFVLDDLSDGHGESAEFGAIETKWRPYYTAANLNTQESTFVHEFTHQWYGNSVLLGQWSDLWLNEGFATYVTDLYYENAGISTSANTRYTNVYNNTAANKEWWSYPSAGVENESDLWGGAAAPYRKAGLALSVLRTSIGDTKFLQLLEGWATTKAGTPQTTTSFLSYASAIADRDLTEWADAWLYGKVKPTTLSLNGLAYEFATTSVPTISGTVKVGTVLTANTGTWSPAPAFTYQWYADGVAISGATKSTFTPTKTQLGKKITVKVTGSKTGYSATGKTSVATAKVTADIAKSTVPTISGTVNVGKALTVNVGAWDAGVTHTYQWYANGAKISGATKSKLTLTKSHLGKTITVKITGSKANHVSKTLTSKATSKVATTFTKSAVPKIKGTLKVGKKLSINLGTWSPKPTYKYQWYSNGKAIKGATKATFTLTKAQKGKKITVKVTASKTNYVSLAKTSKATSKIK